ncbi:unnamed protein product [Amaranthus hypochondriacus]
MSTKELTGGARIRYIFQSIFIKTLEEIDPCEDLTNEDIRIAIQNSMGSRNKLFVPEVPFEALIRRQIDRLLEPSLQCLQFACNELLQMSHFCESRELQRFPAFQKRLEAVILNFLYDATKPVEKRIVETIEMEADDINTSHPNFVGGQKAIELAKQRIRGSKGTQNSTEHDRSTDPSSKLWSKPLKFWNGTSSNDGETSNTFETPISIQLKEPAASIKPTDEPTEDEQTEVLVTRMLLKSYFDIVRKKVEDDIPKAIMHFLVNHLKRELHSTFIRTFYREELFEELLQENSEIMNKRKRTTEMYKVLQKAVQTLGDFEFNVSSSKPYISYETQPTSRNKYTSRSSSKNYRGDLYV